MKNGLCQTGGVHLDILVRTIDRVNLVNVDDYENDKI
jgi:hypothetical protein